MSDTSYLTDYFDRALGALEGLPDTVKTKPSTLVASTPLVGNAETFIVQTFRQDGKDTVFLQHVNQHGSRRIVIPPMVSALIARQRDALSAANRSKAAKAEAAARKANGWKPNFKPKTKSK